MKLTKDMISKELGSLDGWKLEGDAITKQFVFRDFREAMDFVDSVADIAEKADHHPDMTINYKRVTLTLSTHSEGCVTQKDIDLAKEIEEKI